MDFLNQAKNALGGAATNQQAQQNAPAGSAGVPGGLANQDVGQQQGGGAVGATGQPTGQTGQQDALGKCLDSWMWMSWGKGRKVEQGGASDDGEL